MKNFDLEAAKRGAAVCTRDGRNARIIAFDCKGCGRKPILALIDMGDWEQSTSWTERGEIIEDFKDASDLMMRDDDYLEKLERGEYQSGQIRPLYENPSISMGLTKREWFAGMAMSAQIAGVLINGAVNRTGKSAPDVITEDAILFADALIAELEKTGSNCSKGSHFSKGKTE